MKKLISKFDFIFLLIILFAFIFGAEQYLFKSKISQENDMISLTVKAEIDPEIKEEDLGNIKELYFSNALKPSQVKEIKKEGNQAYVTFYDEGIFTEDRLVFNGQHTALNKRVRVHGILDLEGYVLKSEKIK